MLDQPNFIYLFRLFEWSVGCCHRTTNLVLDWQKVFGAGSRKLLTVDASTRITKIQLSNCSITQVSPSFAALEALS